MISAKAIASAQILYSGRCGKSNRENREAALSVQLQYITQYITLSSQDLAIANGTTGGIQLTAGQVTHFTPFINDHTNRRLHYSSVRLG